MKTARETKEAQEALCKELSEFHNRPAFGGLLPGGLLLADQAVQPAEMLFLLALPGLEEKIYFMNDISGYCTADVFLQYGIILGERLAHHVSDKGPDLFDFFERDHDVSGFCFRQGMSGN